jgi:hypothetical protein
MLVKTFLFGTVCLLVNGNLLKDQTAVAASQSSFFHVHRMISEWNEKRGKNSEIVIFYTGNDNFVLEKIVKSIPGNNPMLIVNPNHCERIENRDDSFIIIATDLFEEVSEIFYRICCSSGLISILKSILK